VIFRQYFPSAPLAKYVHWFWFFEAKEPPHRREHVLPDGTFELVVDLRDEPRRMFDRDDANAATLFRRGWISGTHSRYIVIDALPNASMIGVHFKPGGAGAFLGLPAEELRDQVVEIETLWGTAALHLREQLLAALRPELKFRILERFLLGRLVAQSSDGLLERRVMYALDQFRRDSEMVRIGEVVDQLGISHKHFVAQFRRHVGLAPKMFCRVLRFQDALAEVAARKTIAWADVAQSCGYFDQAHFATDFRDFSGFKPSTYLRRRDVEYPNFVPVEEPR